MSVASTAKALSETPAVAFAELPVPKQVCCNTTERSATLRIGNASLDIYPSCDTEQMKKNWWSFCAYAERFRRSGQGLHRLRLHGSAQKGIDGLARLVQQQFALDPFTNTLFLFCGRRRDRIKGLYWEKDGFILLYKRLEQGGISVAALGIRGKDANAAAVPLAHGGTAN